ncbi:helix-turn-helix transcriptional regulator [Microbacterium yannicii]|uniref:helix-turn-helix transcriptional regulator n=1 Tax=Microbacterium yannicii TaxID=671622 RepID=UPI0003061CDD|nr:LuxR family transcriptional regulator [Microbacterium yannicii]
MTHGGSGVELLGRQRERTALGELVTAVRAGTSAALILRGEAGIGKTALLEYARSAAAGCRILRVAGVESEIELSYAALHQLCGPLLSGLDSLPEPQQDALARAFGLRSGGAPDRFMVGLAVLTLFADAAAEQSLVCLIDDLQWLDQASALTLAFVGRRLLAESVLLIFAVREPTDTNLLAGLPGLFLKGLSDAAARRLLDSVAPGRIDPLVRQRILSEAAGNPLALLEMPRGLIAPELASGFLNVAARSAPSHVEDDFLRRVQALPEEPRRMLVLAAADPVGDVRLLRRAAKASGFDVDLTLSHGHAADLIFVDTQVHFRHPLVRSATYRAASYSDRLEAHRALAESIDARAHPDQHAWHLGQATSAPHEAVARELVRSAEVAQARGGIAAMAAFLERAATLTPDPKLRSQRALDAAQAKLLSGAFDQAAGLVALAEIDPHDDLGRARVDILNAQIALMQNHGNEATPLLLSAAGRLERVDVSLARRTYLDAVGAALFASHLADGPGLREVGAAAAAAPTSDVPQLSDRLLDALSTRLTVGYVAAVPRMRAVLEELCENGPSTPETLRWLLFGSVLASELWDLDQWLAVATRHVAVVRETGTLTDLPLAIDALTTVQLFAGDLKGAAALIEEAKIICEAIGSPQARLGPLLLAVFQGREDEARSLIDETLPDATSRGQGAAVLVINWYHALLCNSLSLYSEALAAAERVVAHPEAFTAPWWALAEMIEAAARSGHNEIAAQALDALSGALQASGTDWALGVEARSRALLHTAAAAEGLYRSAIEHLSRTRANTDLARAHLLYGEWLRRENRRVDARNELRIAHRMLDERGLHAFADRARRELQATGTVVHPPKEQLPTTLTMQEEQIARMAGEGLTNPEIGARLFLSPHTVDWHLRKVFTKLGIASRREIRGLLSASTSV